MDWLQKWKSDSDDHDGLAGSLESAGTRIKKRPVKSRPAKHDQSLNTFQPVSLVPERDQLDFEKGMPQRTTARQTPVKITNFKPNHAQTSRPTEHLSHEEIPDSSQSTSMFDSNGEESDEWVASSGPPKKRKRRATVPRSVQNQNTYAKYVLITYMNQFN